MGTQRTRTTYTFSSQMNAARFGLWLRQNPNDRDYGFPLFVDARQISELEWCVEYEYDRDNQIARGVAIGIDLP